MNEQRLWALVLILGSLVAGGLSERLFTQSEIGELAESVEALATTVAAHDRQFAHNGMGQAWATFLEDRAETIRVARDERAEMRDAITELAELVAVLADRSNRQ